MQALNQVVQGASQVPLCEAEGLSVRCQQKLANDRVSIALRPGEVVALLGENGAGKSTLLHALYGLVQPCAGTVCYHGRPVVPTPERAIAAGLGLIHQHFLLVPTLTVAENIVLGQEPRRFGLLVDGKRAVAEVEALGERHGLAVAPQRLVSELSVGEAQRVEILKALYRGAKLLLLDEPTAVLTPGEAVRLLTTLRRLLDEDPSGQRALLLVTHKLDEVLQVADRAVVMRDGRVVEEFQRADFSSAAMAKAMVGRDIQVISRATAPVRTASEDSPGFLHVQDLVVEREGTEWVRGVSFSVSPGQIVGIAGVAGNGQSELVAALSGLLPVKAGRIQLGAEDITRTDVHSRLRRGLAVVPEDRQRHGLVLDMTLAENLLLGHQQQLSRGPGACFSTSHGFAKWRPKCSWRRMSDPQIRTPWRGRCREAISKRWSWRGRCRWERSCRVCSSPPSRREESILAPLRASIAHSSTHVTRAARFCSCPPSCPSCKRSAIRSW
jgi:ABC-type uncharacterized transport system ATPase subunit